jgi:chemotaxis protein CheY-P-specific phosphatase CheC
MEISIKNSSKLPNPKISESSLEKLRNTISHIVAGTSRSLEMLTGEEYQYSFGRLNEAKPQFLDQLVGIFSGEVCAVYLKSGGDITAGMMMFLTYDEARQLARRLLGNDNIKEIDGLGRSSISEVGNILFAGSFLNTISKNTGFRLTCSTPGFAMDNLKGIIEFPIGDISSQEDRMIIAEAQFIGEASGIRIKILIFIGITDALKLAMSFDANKSNGE